ncbi:MAG: PDZ domain-containing protein [Nocardioidaceae bacterium]
MSRRTLASVLVACLLLALAVVAFALPVPYVTESPGPTVNVLGDNGSKPVIGVRGHKTYPTRGQLRLTTVSVTNPTRRIGLAETLEAWFDKTRAVYPRDVIYPPEQTAQESEQQSNVEMVSSQDTAVAAALTELGYTLPLQIEVLAVTKGSPAAGRLRTRDLLQEIDGVRITGVEQVSQGIQRSGAGKPVTIVVRRGTATKRLTITPKASADDPTKAVVGIQIGTGYDFPFDVSVRLGESIGGPSAGLIFSLGVYDTLTPGSLTGGTDIAGTGTIDEDGRVGTIGGVQQKIVAARNAGARIFLVPPGNCSSALHADVRKDQIELVKAPTLHSAVQSLEAYARDKGADLPSCG